MTLEPGTRLGPYEIVELRGKGGMVWVDRQGVPTDRFKRRMDYASA